MSEFNLRQAEVAAGTSKRVLLRAIRSGRIVATRKPGGGWVIPESEIERCFTVLRPPTRREAADAPQAAEVRLEMEVAAMRRFLEAQLRRNERAVRARKAAAEQDVRPWWRRLAG